ncbi:MAG: TetR/AcrR family transcriptional regulator [Verrucomicrobiota bacterium]
MKRVSKSDWLQEALLALEEDGIDAIKVERLAKRLNISKSGFYWHFKNREDLINEIIDYWAHEYTEVVTTNPLFHSAPPLQRLEKIMEMIIDADLTQFELEMQSWGKLDPRIAKKVQQVYEMRLAFSRDIFRELGFKGVELEVRTRMFIGYHVWESTTFRSESKKDLRKYIKAKVALLTKK